MNKVLEDWNHLPREAAEAAILPCNGASAWARDVSARRPFATPELLFAAADVSWSSLAGEDWDEAFHSHPRLGEQKAAAATPASLAWSQGEQRALADTEAQTAALLAEGNRLYERRFGRVFLLCATGKTAAEVLLALGRRLENDPGTELLEAAEQQRRITQLRLRKWLSLPAAVCDNV